MESRLQGKETHFITRDHFTCKCSFIINTTKQLKAVKKWLVCRASSELQWMYEVHVDTMEVNPKAKAPEPEQHRSMNFLRNSQRCFELAGKADRRGSGRTCRHYIDFNSVFFLFFFFFFLHFNLASKRNKDCSAERESTALIKADARWRSCCTTCSRCRCAGTHISHTQPLSALLPKGLLLT